MKQLDDQLAAANAAYAKLQPDLARAQQEWERSLDTSTPVAWAPARGLVAHYSFDSDLTPQVAVLQEAKGPRSPASAPRGGAVNAPAAPRPDEQPGAPAPAFAPGQIGQAASFDGKSFIQFDGDIAGFDSYGSGRGALGENDPTVTYDDAYTMAAWIYPDGAERRDCDQGRRYRRAQWTRAEPERWTDRGQLRHQVGG